MANRCFMTVVSKEFQNYAPLYIMALRTWFQGDIRIYFLDEVRPNVLKAMKLLGESPCRITERYPDTCATESILRFVYEEPTLVNYDNVAITDVDILLLNDIWGWGTSLCTRHHPFTGYRGTRSRSRRPEICKRWVGEFARTAGGIFCVGKRWWDVTREQRLSITQALREGKVGKYREEDEVLLSRIIVKSGMPLPGNTEFTAECRGIHIGDWAYSYRRKFHTKMKRLLHKNSVSKYLKLRESYRWTKIVKQLDSSALNKILYKMDTYLVTGEIKESS